MISLTHVHSLNLQNATVGDLLSRIDAYDADSGENGRLSFRIVTIGEDTVPFNITNDTGELRLTAPLDRETREQYHVRSHRLQYRIHIECVIVPLLSTIHPSGAKQSESLSSAHREWPVST